MKKLIEYLNNNKIISIIWRYLIGVLLAAFVFDRFYDEEAFLNQFHFKLVYFVAACK